MKLAMTAHRLGQSSERRAASYRRCFVVSFVFSCRPHQPLAVTNLSEPRTADTPDPDAAPLVLIAEDNDDNRLIASAILRHHGFRVMEAVSGADAIRMAHSARPQLILMDVGLPDVDGWTATRTLKADASTRHIVVIAFTAHALPGDREMAREVGCDGYLAKPVELSQLVREVRAALAPQGSSGAGVSS